MNEVKFRRIGGRVVPIRSKGSDFTSDRKQLIKGSAQIATGSALSIGSGIYAGNLLKKANFAYGRSATLRGASKLLSGRGNKYSDLLRQSASLKVKARSLTKKSSAVLFAGTTVAGIIGSLGANNVLKHNKSDERALKVESIGVGVGLLGLAPFGKIGRVANIVKRTNNPKEIFKEWSKQGMRKTSDTISKFSKTKYKGQKPNKSIYKATQQDMFSAKTNKFDPKNWFKGL